MSPFDDARAVLEGCGVVYDAVPLAMVANLQMIIDRFLPLDALPALLYSFNMVNSAFIPAIPCILEAVQ